MKIIFFAILLSLAPITYSKEVCIASEKLNVMKIFFELTGKQNQAILFNLELIEANLRAINHINAGENFEFIESLDEYQKLYLERIIVVIDFRINQGWEYDLYENRLGSLLEQMKAKKNYFPATISSPEFFRLSQEVEKKLNLANTK